MSSVVCGHGAVWGPGANLQDVAVLNALWVPMHEDFEPFDLRSSSQQWPRSPHTSSLCAHSMFANLPLQAHARLLAAVGVATKGPANLELVLILLSAQSVSTTVIAHVDGASNGLVVPSRGSIPLS
eukprot:scaffold54673_cov18-Tisochrysis_lutea.AAC.3